MTNNLPEENTTDGVSKKLKIFVIILTAVTFLALVALFTKIVNKPIGQKINQPAIQGPLSNQGLTNEYKSRGKTPDEFGFKRTGHRSVYKSMGNEKNGQPRKSKGGSHSRYFVCRPWETVKKP